MENQFLIQNAQCLEREYAWLLEFISVRMQVYFDPALAAELALPPAPDLSTDPAAYAQFVRHYNTTPAERLVILLALAPHIKPHLLDLFFLKNKLSERGYTEFGGLYGQQQGGFLPTGETAMFVLAADNLAERLPFLSLFSEQHYFFLHNILKIESNAPREPFLSGTLTPSLEFLANFTSATGEYRPKFSAQFPARRVETPLTKDDLVLDAYALEEIYEIQVWLEHQKVLLQDWNLERRIKRGYRALFYGPPGTGKTMTAALLGKLTKREVYKIDLSQVVSKYIGETEKNLANIFDQAESGNWILFFDEADALFGRRSLSKDAKDRYANQEVAYLLQRIEEFSGVAILATNFKGNIDDAFTRRFQAMVYFPMPNFDQRLRLWQESFSGLPLADGFNWENIAQKYELSGGSIINVLRHCALAAVQRQPPVVTEEDVHKGVRRELRKEGKSGM